MTAIHTDDSKLTPDDLARAVANSRGDVHQPQPGVLTLSNATEFGTVYAPHELRELSRLAHVAGYRVHVDGARFANAVASIGCHPRELTLEAGIDALSFGGTKNGLAFGEAVLFFKQGDGRVCDAATHAFPFHRKGTGHLLSKHRYVSAPFTASLSDGGWLRHAQHANAMAKLFADGLTQLGIHPRFPVQANGVFITLPSAVDQVLQRKGHGYYPFGDPVWKLSRLMCSFDTTEADVRSLLGDIEIALNKRADAATR